MVLLAIGISIITAVPIGILIHLYRKSTKIVITSANIIMTIPSIAMFGIMLTLLAPFNLSLGKVPAIIAIILYNQLPIISNTYIAIENIDKI